MNEIRRILCNLTVRKLSIKYDIVVLVNQAIYEIEQLVI